MIEIDTKTLRQWSARARMLDERLSGSGKTESPLPEGMRRLEKWRDIAARGQDDRFRDILMLAGESEHAVVSRLGGSQPDEASPLPDWVERLPRLLRLIMAEEVGAWDGEPSIPELFSELFRPLGRGLRDTLTRTWAPSRWSERAAIDLSHGLLRRIAPPFARPLQAWFQTFREVMGPQLGATPSADEATELHLREAYLRWLRQGHLIRLLDKWPLLARFLSVTTAQWERFALEIVERLEADLPRIVEHLFEGRDPGAVVGLEAGVSDWHGGGRCVAILRFAHGQRLVYKPSDLAIDRAWSQLLDWMRRKGAPVELRSPKVWGGHGYGWVEHIAHAPCRDETEARAHFRRSGALLALFHVLGSCDFHQENLIAAGDQPIAIDLETLLGPDVSPDDGVNGPHAALNEGHRLLNHSVLRSGFLPVWTEFRGQTRVIGGLSLGASSGPSGKGLPSNTDNTRPGAVLPSEPQDRHLAVLNGTPLHPADHAAEIDSGFLDTCRFLIAHREAFAQEALPLFHGVQVRWVCRETRFYSLMRERALQPPLLRDGLESSLEFELLWRLHDSLDEAVLAQIKAERRALGQLDIPLFRMSSDSTRVEEANGDAFHLTIPGKTVLPPYRHALNRLAALDEEHLRQQSRFIQLTLQSSREEIWPDAPWPERPASPWNPEAAVQRAVAMGERILARAIVRGDGAVWLGVGTLGLEERPHLTLLGRDLYDGAGGIAVFLAALYRITGRKEFRAHCLRALAPVRLMLAQERRAQNVTSPLKIGGGVGLGSILYSLVLCASLAGIPELLVDAGQAATLFTDARLSADRVFDVSSGAAGAILGLLALHEVSPDAFVLNRAMACGWHLTRNHRPAKDGSTPHLAGFAHGAAGVSHALDALAEVSGEHVFATTAAEWVTYERVRFHTVDDPRPERFVCGWCRGATGIGLARLGRRRRELDAETLREIETALTRTIAAPMSTRDHVCCGNFGRLELLLQAGEQLDRPALMDLARERATIRLEETSNGFHWPVGSDDENPGFFQGLSGIGYGLLRLAHPDVLPSVLLWRSPAPSACR